MPGNDEFFAFARERYNIMLRKQAGQAPPWTDDPVLQANYFCNIFREDDKTTAWLREYVRNPLDTPNTYKQLVTAVVAFRWFNHIPTGQLLLPMLLTKGWDERLARKLLRGAPRLFTGAYIIMPRPGVKTDKLDAVCWVMQRFKGIPVLDRKAATLQEAHTDLMASPGMGPFYAYEVVTDLNHTTLLGKAMDADTWANPGPGAARGIGHLLDMPKPPSTGSVAMREFMRGVMHGLMYSANSDTALWPSHWPRWDMRTAEHTLCEYDKYVRGQNGQQLKRKYNGKG